MHASGPFIWTFEGEMTVYDSVIDRAGLQNTSYSSGRNNFWSTLSAVKNDGISTSPALDHFGRQGKSIASNIILL